MKRNKATAYVFAALKYVIYGLSIFFTGTLTATTDILDILSIRFLISALVLWLLKLTKIVKIDVGIKDFFKKGARSSFLPSLILAAMFEPVLYMLFETLGISMSTAVTTSVILSLIPISSVVCESLILKEKTSILQKIFLALGVVGVVYIAVFTKSSDGKDSVFGILFLVLAVLCGSLFQVFSRKSSAHFTAFEVTYFSCLLGAVAFNAINVVRHLIRGDILHYFDPLLNVDNLIGFAFLAILSTIIATGMGNYSLGRIQATTMSAFSGVSTLTSVLVGVFLGGETLYYFHYIGFSLILIRMVGVSVIAIQKDRKKAAAEAKGDAPEPETAEINI